MDYKKIGNKILEGAGIVLQSILLCLYIITSLIQSVIIVILDKMGHPATYDMDITLGGHTVKFRTSQ